MANVTRVLETSLYVADLERSRAFYQSLFGFPQIEGDAARFCALDVAGAQVLLLFLKGASGSGKAPGGPHGGSGQLHLAFAIPAEQWDDWIARLEAAGVPIESRVDWPRGGRSLYFREPDGHLLELVTPGCWKTY